MLLDRDGTRTDGLVPGRELYESEKDDLTVYVYGFVFNLSS